MFDTTSFLMRTMTWLTTGRKCCLEEETWSVPFYNSMEAQENGGAKLSLILSQILARYCVNDRECTIDSK
jgi:hypothetical protein